MASDETHSQAYREAVQKVIARALNGDALPQIETLLVRSINQFYKRIPRNIESFKGLLHCVVELYRVNPGRAEQLLVPLAQIYAAGSPFERAKVLEAVRTSELNLYLIWRWLAEADAECQAAKTSPPARALFMTILYGGDFIKQRSMAPVVLGMGANAHYNLGIASTGEVVKPRLVNTDNDIIKASLSTSHSLLLAADGFTYAMGRCESNRAGLPHHEFAASPQLVPLPKGTNVVDIAAGEGYSLFLTRKSLFGCGSNKKGHLGIGKEVNSVPLQRLNLPPLRELTLDEVVAEDNFTLVTTSMVGQYYLSGTSFGNKGITKTFSLYEDYDPEWDDISTPCDAKLIPCPRISAKPHCGIVTGQLLNLKFGKEEYTVRFILFNKRIHYRFALSHFIGEVHSIYRGRVAIWPKSDTLFEAAKSSHKRNERDMSYLAVVFLLEAIPNTAYAHSLGISPDGLNALFVIGAREELEKTKPRSWASQSLIANPIKDVPFDAKICLGGRSWPIMSSVLALRVPNAHQFMKGKNLHVEEVLAGFPVVSKRADWRIEFCEMIVQYVKEGFVIWNADIWEQESDAYDFIKRALAVVGLKAIGYEPSSGRWRRALVSSGGTSGSTQSNCTLVCVDPDEKTGEISANRQLLEIYSHYFVLAGRHEGKDRFVVRESRDIVSKILEAMASPDSLVCRTKEELCRMLLFCDSYLMENLIDDIVQAYFVDATPSCIQDISNLYNWSVIAQDAIVREFVARPDLVFLYSKSASLGDELAKRICTAIEQKHSRKNQVTVNNPLMVGQAIWNSTSDRDWGNVDEERLIFQSLSLDHFADYMLGSGPRDKEMNYLKTYLTSARGFSANEGTSSVITPLDREEFDWMEAVVDSLKGYGPEEVENISLNQRRRRRRTDTERKTINSISEEPQDELVVATEKLRLASTPEAPQNSAASPPVTISTPRLPTESPAASPSSSRLDELFPTLGSTPSPAPKHGKKMNMGSASSFRRFPEPVVRNPVDSVAPWAHVSTPAAPVDFPQLGSTPPGSSKSSSRRTPGQRTPASTSQRIRKESWTEFPSPATASSPGSSLTAIMQEEKQLQEARHRRTHRPLAFVDMEEQAIAELHELYRQEYGDEVLIDVCRVDPDTADPVWNRPK
ncbi:unnamed protein product, partial [Mesorhabditis spiculigera]